MLDGSSLFAIEGLEIGDGHRWQIGLQQVKPINHLSRFVRNSYQVSTLPYAGDKEAQPSSSQKSRAQRSPAEHCGPVMRE
jgi:hypothetical protein